MSRLLLVGFLLLVRVAAGADVEVLFAPGPAVEARVVKEIGSAKRTILVRAYSFSSKPIADALIAAKRRGVDVECVIDWKASQQRGNAGKACSAAGVKVWTDDTHPIAHIKAITIDGETTLAGSYNWSRNAARNAEGMLIVKDAAVAKQYVQDFEKHQAHSKRVE